MVICFVWHMRSLADSFEAARRYLKILRDRPSTSGNLSFYLWSCSRVALRTPNRMLSSSIHTIAWQQIRAACKERASELQSLNYHKVFKAAVLIEQSSSPILQCCSKPSHGRKKGAGRCQSMLWRYGECMRHGSGNTLGKGGAAL